MSNLTSCGRGFIVVSWLALGGQTLVETGSSTGRGVLKDGGMGIL